MKPKTIEAARTRAKAPRPGAANPSTNVPAPSPGSGKAVVEGERACPTRVDGAMPLFQHRVTLVQCQSKQRGMYHKCFSCAHSNGKH